MRQKTFKVGNLDLNFAPEVGQEVILVSREYKDTVAWSIMDAPDGVGGNMNPAVKKYHGWRGTTCDVALYAHGLRRITRVVGIDSGYKITVGSDLRPDLA